MIGFLIRGRVRDEDGDRPLKGLFIKAYDKDLLFDDLMGTAFTDERGRFEIVAETGDFRDFFEKRPDIYLKVFAPDRQTVLHTTEHGIRWDESSPADFDLRIPGPRETPAVRFLGADGGRDSFDAGEPLAIEATGLRPIAPCDVIVEDEDGSTLFECRLLTDRRGTIPETVVWGQIGLDDPESDQTPTLDDARRRWAGRGLAVRLVQDGELVVEGRARIPSTFERPLVLSTDGDGRPVNGFEAGERAALVSVRNLGEPDAIGARVYMVPHQAEWRVGDALVPARLRTGEAATVTVDLEPGDGDFDARVAEAEALLPGAYDFVVRPLRYGYESDAARLTGRDHVMRGVTGLVVREAFMPSKVVRGGCVNMQQIAGRRILGAPYIKYTDVFQVGEDVWAALDPTAIHPGVIGKMVALYLVESKTTAQWNADSSLQHLPSLGGNAATPKLLTQSYCINANKVLIWPAANAVGEYDIVADFGNHPPQASNFVQDDSYDTPFDMIDGYMVPGFRVVPDPTVDTSVSHAGSFQYDETTQGSVTVVDDWGFPVTVPVRASVFFPADAAGATTPGQISGADPDYPLVVVVHGNSSATTSYLGYDYLLEHLARNGFIAASIHLEPGMLAEDRARVLFEHLDILNGMFGASVQNNIGVMGHSRGGEAVVLAAELNQSEGLGHGLNAIISLAPTSWIANPTLGGAWATPYLVVYGSMDGDVAGIANTGFELYDRANGAEKSMVFVHGSTHGRYNTVWGDTDITASWSSLGPTDIPKLINADAHRKIAKGYMTAFFRQELRGETAWRGLFQGDWIPAAVEAADGGKVRLYVQHEGLTHREVDNFQGAHSATSWQASTIGGAVSQSGLPVVPQEAETYPTDPHSPHETGALFLRWDGAADAIEWDIPAGQRNVSGYAALSFRIGQKVGGTNPAGLAQDLRATLRDGSGNTRAVRVGKFAEIPPPHERDAASLTKSAMSTVRIPLRSYVIRCAGIPEVDLTDVVSVSFEFAVNPAGEVLIDSVEFTD